MTGPDPLGDVELPRDRWGRPLIIPPGGGIPVAYTRASSLGGTLEDKTAITNWKMRNVALGLAARPDLVALAAAKRNDKKALGRIADDACEHALASAAANTGTALHGFIEQVNLGQEPWGVPADLKADIDAYRRVTRSWDILGAEQFIVCDELKVAGTFDFTARIPHRRTPAVVDLKTGENAVRYGQGEIAVQLAIYAHGHLYDPGSGARTDLGVSQQEAFVIHLPATSGRATVYRVDIVAGWEAAQHAVWVRDWRKRKHLFGEMNTAVEVVDQVDAFTERLAAVWTVDNARLLYRELVRDGHDPAKVEAACRARIAELEAAT